jgi:hypothetical protein
MFIASTSTYSPEQSRPSSVHRVGRGPALVQARTQHAHDRRHAVVGVVEVIERRVVDRFEPRHHAREQPGPDAFDKPPLAPRTARHAEVEIAAVCRRPAGDERLERRVGHPERPGDVVGGAERQHCAGTAAPGQPPCHASDRAVATGDGHEIPTLAQGLAPFLLLLR